MCLVWKKFYIAQKNFHSFNLYKSMGCIESHCRGGEWPILIGCGLGWEDGGTGSS